MDTTPASASSPASSASPAHPGSPEPPVAHDTPRKTPAATQPPATDAPESPAAAHKAPATALPPVTASPVAAPHAGPALITWQDGQPFSPHYGDRYHTLSGARAQAGHVFLGGCGLPDAWHALWKDTPEKAHQPPQASPHLRPPRGYQGALPEHDAPPPELPTLISPVAWTILETGFGLGLNFLSTWDAWVHTCAAHAPSPLRLRFVSTEAHPVRAADIRRAAADDPVLEPLAAQLADAWPDDAASLPFIHLHLALELPDGLAHGTLELLILLGDTTQSLDAWYHQHGSLGADSIFLDGFDPKKNPAMWSETTLRAIARHGRPGARIATWCVARSVRDALDAAGFRWQKCAGLPPKRHCLTGVLGPSLAEPSR